MYPYVAGGIDELSPDVNHDDYYGNGGAFDVRNSAWLERLDLPRMPLGVSVDGAGTVTSDAGAIDCPGACSTAQEQGLVLTLEATAAPGAHFAGWSGACTGAGTCAVTLDAAKNVSATFAPGAPPRLKISVRGKGRVVSSPAAGGLFRLRPVAATGFRFSSWSGACHGHGACTIGGGSVGAT